jgi:hypothetical protein
LAPAHHGRRARAGHSALADGGDQAGGRRRELDCYQKHKQGEIDALASLAETDQAKRSAEVY